MRSIFTGLFFLITLCAFSQTSVSLLSWNIKDFGKSKSAADIGFIANTIKDFDVVAIQEVVAGAGGPQAVARLHDALNRMGFKWDYVLSEPTSGTPHKRERYVFLWKTSKLRKVGKAWLDKSFHRQIEREPYLINLASRKDTFTFVSFHAIPQSQQPEREIKYFRFLPSVYKKYPLVIGGDFNLPQSHSVFSPLKKKGYASALEDQKTSLKQKCIANDCLASELDNFFYDRSALKKETAGIIQFYRSLPDIKASRRISDHVPVFLRLSFLEK